MLDPMIARERSMHFYAFTLVESNDYINTVEESMEWLKDHGIDIVELLSVTKENLYNTILIFEKRIEDREILYPTDGIIITYNDIEYGKKLGTTGKFPKHSYAFKWNDDVQETKLLRVEWSASKTGLINPVAVFEPVELEGTTVTRATFHNIRYIQNLKLGYGDTITIYKANKIIPAIFENITKNRNYIEIPRVCPVYGSETIRKTNSDQTSEFLYCPNNECIAKHSGEFIRLMERNGLNVSRILRKQLKSLLILEC